MANRDCAREVQLRNQNVRRLVSKGVDKPGFECSNCARQGFTRQGFTNLCNGWQSIDTGGKRLMNTLPACLYLPSRRCLSVVAGALDCKLQTDAMRLCCYVYDLG